MPGPSNPFNFWPDQRMINQRKLTADPELLSGLGYFPNVRAGRFQAYKDNISVTVRPWASPSSDPIETRTERQGRRS